MITILVLITAYMSGCASTGVVRSIKAAGEISEEEIIDLMSAKILEFHVGKRFIFLIAWNRIPMGRIIAEIPEIKEYKGRDVYVVRIVTESNDFLSKIYRVEDTYTSYVDVENMTSRRYEADRKEGNYRKHLVVEYDFNKYEAIYTNLVDGSVKRCTIEDNVQDPVSAICYFMTIPVKPGDEIGITINLNEKNYKLFGKVGRAEMLKLSRIGEWPAFKIRPYAELDKKRVEKGKVWMYFSADKNRYPLQATVLIPFGKVTAVLRSIESF